MKLVVFPYHDWRKADIEGHRWRDAHLIDALAARTDVERILVVDRPVSLAERVRHRSPGFAQGRTVAERRRRAVRARLTAVDERIHVLDVHVPDVLGPIRLRREWWFRTFAEARVLDAITWAATTSGMDRPRVIAWLPTVAPAVAALQPSGLVFDSLDNWMIHPGLRRYAASAAAGYAAMLPTASGVAASAPASRDVLLRWADHVEVIPNGVDPGTFAGSHARPRDLPPGAVIGYAGSLAQRVDSELVAAVARDMPEVAFVFIGQLLDPSSIAAMRGIPNIHILGDRHYKEIPAYLAHFDVAWIPHRVGPGESGGDPIKLYEYWAAGREVVSTRIDGLDVWSDRVHFVADVPLVTALLRGLLDGTVPAKHAQVPSDRTWDAIADRIVAMFGPAT